jgi:hypothetical protein
MVPPHQINPLTQLWKGLIISQIMNHQIPWCIKLAQIVVMQVIRSMEDGSTFSTLNFTFLKKLRNRLTIHLDLVIHMFSQHLYTLENFPYDVLIIQ